MGLCFPSARTDGRDRGSLPQSPLHETLPPICEHVCAYVCVGACMCVPPLAERAKHALIEWLALIWSDKFSGRGGVQGTEAAVVRALTASMQVTQVGKG